MLKLTTSISKKIGQPDFGSRGASVGMEVELDTRLIEDPEALGEHIRQAFNVARQEVDAELNRYIPLSNGREQDHRDNGRPNDRFSESGSGNGKTSSRSATTSQVRAIHAICKRQQIDADRLANERFSVTAVEELTLQEASSLIDELKSAPTNGQNGGGR